MAEKKLIFIIFYTLLKGILFMSQGMSHPLGSSFNGSLENTAEFELGTTLVIELV
jgi:hypothetical protein